MKWNFLIGYSKLFTIIQKICIISYLNVRNIFNIIIVNSKNIIIVDLWHAIKKFDNLKNIFE